jgi:hypothetical protein
MGFVVSEGGRGIVLSTYSSCFLGRHLPDSALQVGCMGFMEANIVYGQKCR